MSGSLFLLALGPGEAAGSCLGSGAGFLCTPIPHEVGLFSGLK